ncbi:MAG: carbohydrate porin [Rhodocyclales bacterium]|nr:carbohydrate porin [Rhodocyclales bacterium]
MTATAIRLTLLIAVVLTGTAYAADDTPAPNRDGILFEGGLKIDTLRNRGALRDGTRTVSHLDLKLKMDLEKAVGWQGGSAMINVIRDAGRGPNEDLVGSLMGVTNLEVTSPTTTRLFHAWLQQSLLDEQLSFLVGIYPVDSEFQVMDAAGIFIKPEYGPTADFSLTRGPSIFNNAAFGFRTRWQAADKSLYAQWALMDGIPNDPDHPKRTSVRFEHGDGAFNILEIGWLPEAANEEYKGHAKLALGLWGYTVREDDQLDVANIDAGITVGPARKRRSRGSYLLGERTLMRLGHDDARFVSAFGRYSWTDGDSSPLKNVLSLGIHIKGPLASRPDDIFGLAWSRAGTASKWRDAQAVDAVAADRAERAIELTYRYVVTPWFAVQPNFQRIVNPGALRAVPNSTVIGARFEFTL